MNSYSFNRRTFLKSTGLSILSISLTACFSFNPSMKRSNPFTIIVLPDTQMYTLHYPDIFMSQTKWIKQNKDALNIKCVIHEGDITDKNLNREWIVANNAISILDGVVPYCLTIGNHDLAPGGSTLYRDASLFNKYFPASRYKKKQWYGGHYEDGNENAYYYFNVNDTNFLVLCLEFGARDEVLTWANKIVAGHKSYKIIVTTHCYTYSDDTRVGEGDSWSPHQYACKGNNGDEIWDKFVRKHENIFLVLSGHILNDGLGRLTSTGDHGNKVHQVLTNYQMKKRGGNGWLRIIRFLPKEKKIQFRAYSPFLDEWASDDQNHFELEYVVK